LDARCGTLLDALCWSRREASSHDGIHLMPDQRLGQIILCTETNGLSYLVGISHTRQENHFHMRIDNTYLLEHFHTIETRHNQIEKNQIGLETVANLL